MISSGKAFPLWYTVKDPLLPLSSDYRSLTQNVILSKAKDLIRSLHCVCPDPNLSNVAFPLRERWREAPDEVDNPPGPEPIQCSLPLEGKVPRRGG